MLERSHSMPRKKPYSVKQKKEQLKKKRQHTDKQQGTTSNKKSAISKINVYMNFVQYLRSADKLRTTCMSF